MTDPKLKQKLSRAERAAQAAVDRVLGKDNYGDRHARVIVTDYRLHQPFSYRPTGKREAQNEQEFMDAIQMAEINLSIATREIESINREFRYWLDDRRYRADISEALTRSLKVGVTFDKHAMYLQFYSEVATFSAEETRQRIRPEDIAAKVLAGVKARLGSRKLLSAVVSQSYGLKVYVTYQPSKTELEEAFIKMEEHISELKERLTAKGLKRDFKASSSYTKKDFIGRVKEGLAHSTKRLAKYKRQLQRKEYDTSAP